MVFVNGVIKDTYDERDHQAGAIYAALGATDYPDTLDLRDKLPAIKNQGSRGTCAAFAASTIKEYQERTDSGYTGKFSPEFVYFHRANKPSSGMMSRDVMNILLKQGCCTEDQLPYRKSDTLTELPANVIASAANYKIKEYARVNTIVELKTALFQSGCCYISFPVYDMRPQFWRRSSPDVAVSGGHAVTVVGYNKEGFILRNSWGTSFADRGYVIYPYADFGAHWDIYTSIDVSGSPKPVDKTKCCTIM